MKTVHKYKRKDGSCFTMEMEIDMDGLALYMANKAERNRYKKSTQVERNIRVRIKEGV